MQPISIEDPNIQRKIHHTYRLQYLKDVILGRALDDSTFNVLNTCIIFNQIEIINHIQQDEHFLRELVLLFVRPSSEAESSPAPPPKVSDAQPSASSSASENDPLKPSATSKPDVRKKEVIHLLQQLCVMGKNVQLPARVNLFRTLVERGVLYAVQWALTRPEKHLVFMAGEILTVLLDHGTVAIRNHILVQALALGQTTGSSTDAASHLSMSVAGVAGPNPTSGQGIGEGPERNALSGLAPPPFKETLAQVLCRMLANSQDFALQTPHPRRP